MLEILAPNKGAKGALLQRRQRGLCRAQRVEDEVDIEGWSSARGQLHVHCVTAF